MQTTVTPFLMFEGRCEEALNVYVGLFAEASITDLKRFGPEGPGAAGSVMQARFTLGGREFQCFDSPVHHKFNFTPSISLFVECSDEAEFDRIHGALADGGETLMPAGDHGFSRKFAWINDRFGVSWQFNLAQT